MITKSPRPKAGSIEKIDVVVTASSSLVGTTVQISMTPTSTGVHNWLNADWVDTPTTTGTARTDDAQTLVEGEYVVHYKLGASPETPIRAAYRLLVDR